MVEVDTVLLSSEPDDYLDNVNNAHASARGRGDAYTGHQNEESTAYPSTAIQRHKAMLRGSSHLASTGGNLLPGETNADSASSDIPPQKPTHALNKGKAKVVEEPASTVQEHIGIAPAPTTELTLSDEISRLKVGLRLPFAWDRHSELRIVLAHALQEPFKAAGNVDDIQEAIGHLRDVLHRHPNDSARDDVLYLLPDCLLTHAERTGDVSSITEAIRLLDTARELRDPGEPFYCTALSNLALAYITRFDHIGNREDLAHAILLQEEALKLHPERHPHYTQSLAELADSFSRLFRHTGKLEDLVRAIHLFKRGLACSPGVLEAGQISNNLAAALWERCKLTDAYTDIDECITLGENALSLMPDHEYALNNLSAFLSERYRRMGNTEDLSRSVELQWRLLALTRQDHLDRPGWLSNLATNLTKMSFRTEDMSDATKAVTLCREALQLLDKDHPSHSTLTFNLGAHLYFISHHTADITHIRECLGLLGEAVQRCPVEHPEYSRRLGHLADATSLALCFIANAEKTSLPTGIIPWARRLLCFGKATSEDVRRMQIWAIDMYRKASNHTASPIPERLRVAQMWRKHALLVFEGTSLQEAVQTTLALGDIMLTRFTSIDDHYYRNFRFPDRAALDAANIAISRRELRPAVTYLEQGRTRILGQLGRYRAALGKLEEVHPDLAKRFATTSEELDSIAIRAVDNPYRSSAQHVQSTEDPPTRHLRVSSEWESILSEIRTKPGFKMFLRPQNFEQLQQAAECGPVILINITEHRGDAIIVRRHAEPALVRLPRATAAAVQALTDRLGPRPALLCNEEVVSILRELWDIIVGPVTRRLRWRFGGVPLGSRIWWCPIGAASRLPLHAAGPYTPGLENLPNIFNSSYTPSFGALIRAREAWSAHQVTPVPNPTLLIVGQPDTPNQGALPMVKNEIISIQSHSSLTTVLAGHSATRQAVVEGIDRHDWIHFAWHGHHDPFNSFSSHFCLHDGNLSLKDLLRKGPARARLAFLSACHSAKVSATLPDEALHPAAAMLFAGYQSVIGTMWALEDNIAAALADEFYKLMLDGKAGPKDCSKAARALARALDSLGDKISLSQRINVVHFGV